MKIKSITILLLLTSLLAKAQSKEKLFEDSYNVLNGMIQDESKYSFRKAVFSVENAYLEGKLDTLSISERINSLVTLSKMVIKNWELDYNEKDKEEVAKWATVQQVMCYNIPINYKGQLLDYEPFSYDFDDVFGHGKRENLFVSKLLETKLGNCRSMPYLYKILCEELGTDAHLAIAPNHIYIKHKSIKSGWYNTELTSGIFPIDAWIMASGFVHVDAITNGVYMKALSNKESIAVVLVDLAENYNVKFPENDGTFILKCCQTALKVYPNFANGLILQAETHKKQVDKITDKAIHDIQFKKLEKEYGHIHKLGYRNMPENMYLNWLVSLKEERSKYEDKKLNTFSKQK